MLRLAINAPLVLQKSQLYYRFGGKQMAVKLSDSGGMTTTWLHGDHLGSASFATYTNGAKVPGSDTRYTPFGGYRSGYEGKGLPTDKRFTGHQSEDAALTGGLVFAQARFYLPGLARFVSADTIVPDEKNPQSLNRYSYVFNNPLRYTDKTGHAPTADCGSDPIACFWGIQWGDMNNTSGLTGNWAYLGAVWFSGQRPASLGTWSTSAEGVPTVMITDMSYIRDLISRDHFSKSTALFSAKVQAELGRGKAPLVGEHDFYRWNFELPEASVQGKYTALEWFTGGYTLEYTVTSVNKEAGTAQFRFQVINDSGWESATRIPGRFAKEVGPSLLLNRGGRSTEIGLANVFGMGGMAGACLGLGMCQWFTSGATYRQIFAWDMIYVFKTGKFSLPPPSSPPKTEAA